MLTCHIYKIVHLIVKWLSNTPLDARWSVKSDCKYLAVLNKACSEQEASTKKSRKVGEGSHLLVCSRYACKVSTREAWGKRTDCQGQTATGIAEARGRQGLQDLPPSWHYLWTRISQRVEPGIHKMDFFPPTFGPGPSKEWNLEPIKWTFFHLPLDHDLPKNGTWNP